jgi:hypothetical protein
MWCLDDNTGLLIDVLDLEEGGASIRVTITLDRYYTQIGKMANTSVIMS